MQRSDALARFAAARVARLATIADSGPHLVPVVFAVAGDRVVIAVDDKPKTTRRLKRLANIDRDPRVSLLVDHYEEAWERLWWVRVDGTARVVPSGPEFDRAIEALVGKYGRYRSAPPGGPVIEVTIERVVAWEASGPPG
jgi:PPOX class probable F420-dependent enzyme